MSVTPWDVPHPDSDGGRDEFLPTSHRRDYTVRAYPQAPDTAMRTPLSTWYESAACAGANPELFFSAGRGSERVKRQYCNLCPVQAECLNEHFSEEFGLFGGMTAEERRVLRGQRAK